MARRKNMSMCEKSTLLAVNFVKASSLVLAKMTLGSRGQAPARRPPAHHGLEAPRATTGAAGHLVESPMRSVEPETHSTGYLIEPPSKNISGGVDGRATAYIKRFHEKNQVEHGARSAAFNNIIPPPPTAKWVR